MFNDKPTSHKADQNKMGQDNYKNPGQGSDRSQNIGGDKANPQRDKNPQKGGQTNR